MRRGVVGLIVLVSACSFEGRPSTSVESDPIDAGAIDEDATAAVVDGDGDGVDDAIDNCVGVANSGQHDEDRDQVGDACDNCPHLSNANQLDSTELAPDGVGDACDPNPTGPDQFIFDGFNQVDVDPSWTLGAGWSIDGGALRQTNVNAESLATFALPGFAATGRVVASVEVAGVPADLGLSIAGVTAPSDASAIAGSGCALRLFQNSGDTAITAFNFDPQGWLLSDIPMLWTIGQPTMITADRTPTGLSCTANGALARRFDAVPGSDIGVYSYRSAVRIEWFIAFTPAAVVSPR